MRTVIVEADIEWLITLPKYIEATDWRDSLLPPTPGPLYRRGRLDLGDLPAGAPLGGTLHVYTRQNLSTNVTGDWSVGLVYTDYGNRSYPVIRCNGPHASDHPNRIEGTVIVRTPHIHRLTERYQRLRRAKPDGFAEPTDAYSTIDEALEHMITLANLQPSGMLFL